MKKIKTVFLLCLSMLCCLLFMFGCTKPEPESEPTLAIDRDSIIMEIETSEVITVTTEGIDTSLLAWSSSNEAVATVSEGVVTSVGFGETEITVSYKDQSCKITVKVLDSGIYPNLSVGDTNISLYEEDTFQLTPTLSYAGENVTATYTYTSSDPTVATISASGLISAQSLGTATITVSTEYKAVTVEKEITVNVVCDMQTYVYVGGEQVTLQDITMYTGDVYNFTLKTFYNGQEVNATYQLPAENDIVAVADANDGYTLTAKTVGEVTVQMTAQYNGESIATNFNISVIQKVTQYTTALVGNLSEASQNVKIQVPAQIQLKGDMTLKLNGESLTATVNTTENSLYIAKDLAVAGEYDAIISNVEFSYELPLIFATKVFKQADVANFKSIIESDMAGYYVLGEDLDFADVTDFQAIGGYASTDVSLAFSGTFNGMGYSMTNLYVNEGTGTYNANESSRGSVFGYNTGIIKNVYVEFEVAALTSEHKRGIGFVGYHIGDINNVYAKVTYAGNDTGDRMRGSVVAAVYSGGSVVNCVGELNLTNGATGFGTVVGISYSGSIDSTTNCYGIVNNASISYYSDDSGRTVTYRCTNAKGAPTNSKNLALAILLTEEDFESQDGWNQYWRVTADGVYFGERTIVEIQRATLSFANGESSLNVVYGMPIGELPAIQPFNGLEGAWSVDGEVIESGDVWQYEQDKTAIIIYRLATEANAVLDKYAYETAENNIPTAQSIANAYQIGTLTAVYEKSSYGTNLIDTEGKIDVSGVVDSGKVSFIFVCADGTAYQMVITVIDRTLKQADVANFKTIIESNMAGYYMLGENLDFTGVTLKTIGKYQGASFSGIFDGMGYAMTGITIDENGAGAYNAGVFESLTGTVRNVYVEYTVNSKTQAIGFITENGGVVENIYVKATFNSTAPVVKKYNGVVVAWHNSGAVLKNCVGEMVFADGVSGSLAVGTVLGTNYSNATTVPTTCYGVTNGITLTNGTGEGVCNHYSNTANVMKDSKNVESRSALLSEDFSAANGWSEYWQMKADGLYFGNTLIAAKA